ncbi:MAG: hypothetical protein AB7S48_08070 [Bacteroidales bacterium]
MKKFIILLSIATVGILSFTSCDNLFGDDDEKDSLYVKFENDPSSSYTITNIQIRSRGKVDAENKEVGTWSNNLLGTGESLSPGEFTFFTLDIPSGEWDEYRLGVDNGNGTEVMLYDQTNYDGMTDLPITHWGGDDRTVSVLVTFDDDSQTITVNGWSDWVGIDE